MSAINVSSISFRYSENVTVLNDVSFDVQEKETWAIIGKNGSGKSTLLKCIGGLLPACGGFVSIHGKPVTSYRSKELAKLIAYVPQAGNRTLPPYSVREFVMLGRFPYQGFFALPGKQDREIVEAVLRLTDTDLLADRSLHTLSGGELQRVFLAAAVAQKTAILLLDEPMAFLDPLHQAMMQRSLDRIHDEFAVTMVTVTHDVNLALNRCSHICALGNGKPFFIGTSDFFKENAIKLLLEVYSITFSEIKNNNDNTRYYLPERIS
ncbi:MAG: ABC transporter ATP-binding protein [Chitinispirillaceae bacterium]|jgi:iron complex transport system ATP-binding protein